MKELNECQKDEIRDVSGECIKGHFSIIAKRWFDRIYGNTYHSVDVVKITGEGKCYKEEIIGREPFAYGYGDGYLQTAHELLVKAGYYPYERTKEHIDIYSKTGEHLYSTPKESINKNASFSAFLHDMSEHPERFSKFVSDVNRKKDL